MAPLIGLGKKKEKLEGHLPLMDLVIFTVVANVSIISLNTSLMVNSVAFYQIAKLGIIPFTATVEATFFGKEFSGLMKLAIAVTLVGVGLVTVAEFNVSRTLFPFPPSALSPPLPASGSQPLALCHVSWR